jgi:hypothetical protein
VEIVMSTVLVIILEVMYDNSTIGGGGTNCHGYSTGTVHHNRSYNIMKS